MDVIALKQEASDLLKVSADYIWIDEHSNDSNDRVSLTEAERRTSQIDSDSLCYKYRLCCRMGDKFIADALISFKVKEEITADSQIWLNTSVATIGDVKVNGVSLVDWMRQN